METKSLKKTIYQDEDVHFEVEECGEWLVLHCDVQHWSISKFKRMIRVFAQFIGEAQEAGYKKMVSFSPNPKFCYLFGARFESAFTQKDQTYEVCVWDLK